MQLSRNLFLSSDRKFSRKLQEIMLAIQIERHFTKPQIFTLYANQIFLGHGVYGFEAGSEFYFSKHAKELTIEEAAMLAGLPKAPNFYSPINYPERALRRRNLVINSMMEDGKITVAAGATRQGSRRSGSSCRRDPNSTWRRTSSRRFAATWKRNTAATRCTPGGLRVYTTLDLDCRRRQTAPCWMGWRPTSGGTAGWAACPT